MNELAAAHEEGFLEPGCSVRLVVGESQSSKPKAAPLESRHGFPGNKFGRVRILVKKAAEKEYADVTAKMQALRRNPLIEGHGKGAGVVQGRPAFR